MATEVIKTIKPSGGDYSSLSAWEAGEQADLVTADEIAVAECYSMEDTTSVTIDGWTTDATRYIKIYTPASERHDGKWNTGKYRLKLTRNYGYLLGVNEDYVRVEGIQLHNTTTGDGGCVVYTGTGEFYLSYSILRADSTSGRALHELSSAADNVTVKAWDNVFYDGSKGIFYPWNATGNVYAIYNNTFIDCANTVIAIYSNSSSLYLKNNLVQSTGTNYDISGVPTFIHSNNLSEDATSPDTSYRNKTVTFEDEANDDFHLGSGDTEAKDNGTDLSSDPDGQLSFSDDIDGDTRSGTWDIGADEYVVGGVMVTPAPATCIPGGLDPAVILGAVNITPPPAACVASRYDPAVVLGAISITPGPASLVTGAVDPLVILGPITITPAAIYCIPGGVDPIVIIGGAITITPAPAECFTDGVDPTVILGPIVITPAAAAVIAATYGPVVIIGVGLDLFNPQLKSLKQECQLKAEKQEYQIKSLKTEGQLKWLQ